MTATLTPNTTRRTVVGWTALGLFLATIPFANWWLDRHGLWHSPIGVVPSAVWVVGIAFVLRDVAQIQLGKAWAWAAIAVGVALSYWLANPTIAVASAAAFGWSEATDAAIFTPLANRGRFLLGVAVSGWAASAVDSWLFVRIAFGAHTPWGPLFVWKSLVVAAAAPVAWLVRRWATPRLVAHLEPLP